MKLFLNGQIISQRTFAPATGISTRPYPLTVGRDIFDTTEAFLKGVLDEIKVYNIALTDDQIVDLSQESSVNFTRAVAIQNIDSYPNPTSGQLTINAPFQIEKILITNTHGQQIGSFTSNQFNTFSVRNLSKGLYFIRFENQGKVYQSKVLVME